jgi:hypothetical protein
MIFKLSLLYFIDLLDLLDLLDLCTGQKIMSLLKDDLQKLWRIAMCCPPPTSHLPAVVIKVAILQLSVFNKMH